MCPKGRGGQQAAPAPEASTHRGLRSPAFLSEPRRQQQVHNAQGRGIMKEQGQLQNRSSLQSPADNLLQKSSQSPHSGYSVSPSALRECFLLEESHHHQIRQAAQHAHEHACTCTLVSPVPTVTATSPYPLKTSSSHAKGMCPQCFPQISLIQWKSPTP